MSITNPSNSALGLAPEALRRLLDDHLPELDATSREVALRLVEVAAFVRALSEAAVGNERRQLETLAQVLLGLAQAEVQGFAIEVRMTATQSDTP